MRVLIAEDNGIIAMHLAKLVAVVVHEVLRDCGVSLRSDCASSLTQPNVMDLRLAKRTSYVDAARVLC